MGIPQMSGQNLQVRWDRVPAAHILKLHMT
jgi:hypothetical protein